MAKNVSSSCKDIENWSKGFKDMSPKPEFQIDYLQLPESPFIKKVGGKGLDWCYIGAVSYTHLTLPTNREV